MRALNLRRIAVAVLLAGLPRVGPLTLAAENGDPGWRQFGGPQRDFAAPAGELASRWPDGGPRRLWERPLGAGYSAILADGGRLYTMYRERDEEVVVALEAATGETVWEYRYSDRPTASHVPGFGDGPQATPLLVGDRLLTIGIAGKMHALDRRDGRVLWSRDLWPGEISGPGQIHGYATSPVAWGDTVIVAAGGEAPGLVALALADGAPRWQTAELENSYSSPRLVEMGGDEQLLAFLAEELVALDPSSGRVRWRYPHDNQFRHNISMPLTADGDTIFLSSPQAGARGIRVLRDEDAFSVEELWSNRRVQLYHVSAVRIGDWVYGSSGSGSPAFLTAIDLRNGEVGWRHRGVGKANCVLADGYVVVLDEDGVLYLTSMAPEGLEIRSSVQLFERVAWTVPTIIGSVLFARDNERIVALDLG